MLLGGGMTKGGEKEIGMGSQVYSREVAIRMYCQPFWVVDRVLVLVIIYLIL